MKDFSPFRHWLREIWYENCQEHQEHGELPYTLQEYWNRYKYWLKREFRYQQRHGKR